MRKILVENWKDCWKWASFWAATIIGMLAAAYEYSAALQEYLPDGWFKWAMLVVIAARLYNQTKPQAPDDNNRL